MAGVLLWSLCNFNLNLTLNSLMTINNPMFYLYTTGTAI